MRVIPMAVFLALVLVGSPSVAQIDYSTGAVNNYPEIPCLGPDLPSDIPEANDFRTWYTLAGLHNVTRWENGDVWGSDFRDSTNGSNNDRDPSGGSDITQLYFYTGHGFCENPPVAGSGDFVFVCGNFGKPNRSRIGTQSRWGNNGGRLEFMFLDASCPMDLPEIQSEWFAPFQGLHVATGNSGDVNHDTLESETRGSQFAAYTVGVSFGPFILFPQLSVGDAWMATGTIDVQSQVCAVALAAGNDRSDAINRRQNEFITSHWSNPVPNWFAWRWVCN